MIKYTKLTPASKKFLAWKWCLTEDKNKQLDKNKCNKLYNEYLEIALKKKIIKDKNNSK